MVHRLGVCCNPWLQCQAEGWEFHTPARQSSLCPTALAFDGDSKSLKQSVIIPTLDTPIPEGKNVIWCASFQMAWDRLKNDVIGNLCGLPMPRPWRSD